MESQFVWFELTADDTAKAQRFYEQLFGWQASDAGGYAMIKATASREIGAGIKANGATGMPSHWAPFISVADVRSATRTASQLGAKIVHDVHETPNGIVSTVLDPTGATVNLWQPLPGA